MLSLIRHGAYGLILPPVQPVSLGYTWKANNSGMTPIQYTLGLHWTGLLSYWKHLIKTAGKLQNRNNLLMKLAGSSRGANANTLRSSALALCYSVAEYCCPVWQRSTHVSLVDAQLHSSMCLISGTIRSTPRAGHSSDVLEPLKTHQEQAILW